MKASGAQEGTWKCWHADTVGAHIQCSGKGTRGALWWGRNCPAVAGMGRRPARGWDLQERGSMAHRGFSVHSNVERGGGARAGLCFSLPLGKWSTFLRAVLEKGERQGGRETDLWRWVCVSVCAR